MICCFFRNDKFIFSLKLFIYAGIKLKKDSLTLNVHIFIMSFFFFNFQTEDDFYLEDGFAYDEFGMFIFCS